MISEAGKMILSGIPGVTLLHSAPFEFYLTGSRYIGGARPDSDWDFIVQDSPEIRSWLSMVGFESMMTPAESVELDDGFPVGLRPEYDAEETGPGRTACVWQMKSEHGTVVQVLCAYNAEVKRQIRDIIKQYFFEAHLHANKDEREYLWKTIGELLVWRPAYPFANLEPITEL